MENQLSRNEAWELLTEYTKTPALQKHALAVEAVMSHFARINGEDETAWGVTGLLHDLDYEKYPEEHCSKAAEIMKERGIDDFYIHAVCSHGYGICSEVKPESRMEKVLFTVDGSYQCPVSDASFQKRSGFGSEIRKEEIQGQVLCRRGKQGYHPYRL